jgi:GrpB-like predicted nucleotidyltransferase (UPF0157 family)
MNKILVPHDPTWSEVFTREAACISELLGSNIIELHHIGSTAIPGILAKPIIDILGVVASLEEVDCETAKFERIGYEAMGTFGIDGRRYFRRFDASGARTHHLHVFKTGSENIERHLAFRDYLRRHSERAAEYSELKALLVSDETMTWESYQDGKDSFIKTTESEAVEWYRRAKINRGEPYN